MAKRRKGQSLQPKGSYQTDKKDTRVQTVKCEVGQFDKQSSRDQGSLTGVGQSLSGVLSPHMVCPPLASSRPVM
ncbi:hypothetical protein J6590_046779 [Homalodisca vitripennis]|nr:hypothetical protein J6590_046779 [Homalodisca vitripennis]